MSSASAALTSTTCQECANFIPSNWSCLEWRMGVRPEADACNRFIACSGLVADDFKPLKTVQISRPEVLGVTETSTVVEKETTKKPRKLGGAKVVELILAGHNQYEIARRFGVTRGTVSRHLANAVKRGDLVRVGHGKYVAPESVGTSNSQPNQELSTPEAPATFAGDDRDRTEELEARLERLEEQVVSLRESIVQRFTDVAVFITQLQNATKSLEKQMSVALIETHEEVERLREVGPQGCGDMDLVARLLSIIESQQRILERQLAGQSDIGIAAQGTIAPRTGDRIRDHIGREVA